jgi:hypothetical protein
MARIHITLLEAVSQLNPIATSTDKSNRAKTNDTPLLGEKKRPQEEMAKTNKLS